MKRAAMALAILCCCGSAVAATPAAASEQPAAASLSQAEETILAYDRMLRAADRYLSEGDYPAALDQLQQASRLRPGDAGFYEKLAIAYDADRESAQAFDNFQKAGDLYLAAGELDRAARILEYLRASGRAQPRVAAFELKLNAARLKQP